MKINVENSNEEPLLLDLLIYLIQLVVIGSSHNESMKFESPENIFLV